MEGEEPLISWNLASTVPRSIGTNKTRIIIYCSCCLKDVIEYDVAKMYKMPMYPSPFQSIYEIGETGSISMSTKMPVILISRNIGQLSFI
jgi:hypothetical protein